MSEKLERFGKFLILDHLVDGGMAKICRARQLGEVADKIVAIKMVQPQYSNDPAFQKMFFDEIRVATKLIHPNIVQTYEHGLQNAQLFVAMEYCDGKNLKEYLEKLKEKKFVFPIDVSIYIITQACQGLHYAHTLTDKLTGQTFNIVHRDISPHNIMLTYDGGVKVIDFGIAKAEINGDSTQAGTIKGKLSYLAPEYLEGHTLDKRYDEFAIGITLWEMLCGRKLFKAQNDLAVLKKIQECKIPAPSTINPNVPKELDDIVLKALAKDRAQRYDDLDQLNRALIKFLYAHNPDFNPSDLAYFAKELFKEEIKTDREKLFAFGKINITPYLEDLKKEIETGVGGGKFISNSDGNAGKRENVIDFGFHEQSNSKIKVGVKSGSKKDAVENNLAISGESKLKIDLKKKVKKNPESESEKTKSKISTKKDKTKFNFSTENVVTDNPTDKVKMLLKQVFKVAKVAIVASLALMSFSYWKYPKQFEAIMGSFTERSPASEKQKITKIKEVKMGRIVFQNFSKKIHKVFVNGKEVKVSVLGDLDIPYGNINLRVQILGREHFFSKLDINDENKMVKLTIPETSEVVYGYLVTSSSCANGKLSFNLFSEEREEVLPLKRPIAFPVGIEHLVYYEINDDGLKREASFKIEHEDDTFDLCSKIKY